MFSTHISLILAAVASLSVVGARPGMCFMRFVSMSLIHVMRTLQTSGTMKMLLRLRLLVAYTSVSIQRQRTLPKELAPLASSRGAISTASVRTLRPVSHLHLKAFSYNFDTIVIANAAERACVNGFEPWCNLGRKRADPTPSKWLILQRRCKARLTQLFQRTQLKGLA